MKGISRNEPWSGGLMLRESPYQPGAFRGTRKMGPHRPIRCATIPGKTGVGFMSPMTARTSIASRRGTPAQRRHRDAHRGPRFAWKVRRRSLIAQAKERIRDGVYEDSPALRIAVDRLIDRLCAELEAR